MDKFRSKNGSRTGMPTVFLLHPSQPLSHISRLIAASLAPEAPSISFRSTSPGGRRLEWSESTDVGDFIRDAARATEFEIYVAESSHHPDRSVAVEVPSFADRTRFLRRRLERLEHELQSMEELKRRCDKEAHRGARRMAVGGLAMLVVYWGTVARLTFWDLGWCVAIGRAAASQTQCEFNRDVMEPVTYLSGLSMVILGYLWYVEAAHSVPESS